MQLDQSGTHEGSLGNSYIRNTVEGLARYSLNKLLAPRIQYIVE